MAGQVATRLRDICRRGGVITSTLISFVMPQQVILTASESPEGLAALAQRLADAGIEVEHGQPYGVITGRFPSNERRFGYNTGALFSGASFRFAYLISYSFFVIIIPAAPSTALLLPKNQKPFQPCGRKGSF